MSKKLYPAIIIFLLGFLFGGFLFSLVFSGSVTNAAETKDKSTEKAKSSTKDKSAEKAKTPSIKSSASSSIPKDFKFGYIESQTVFESHPKTKSAYITLENFKSSRQVEFEKKIKEKFGNKQIEELPADQQKEAREMFEADNEKFKKEMAKKTNDYLSPIEKEIIHEVKKISQQKNLFAVFDKAAVIYGGTDITNSVISSLKKK